MRSPRVIASDWSWVTYRLVTPTRRCSCEDLGAHLAAQLGVEVAERLVEKEDLRLAHQRPAHGDALRLAAAQLRRAAVQQRSRPSIARHLAHAPVDLGARHAVFLESEGEVLVHGQVRVEGVVLEDHRHVALA